MLIGHDKQLKYFKNVIKNNALGHAYLFSGPEMVGKKSFALELYKLMNGRPAENDPDLKMVFPRLDEDETKIYIEDIRNLKKFLSFKPYQGPHKVVIIDDAHRLTSDAANSLLKILEEPSSFSVLILVSSLPGLLPATILSRCEEIRFEPANNENAVEYLSVNKKISREDKDFITKIAGGRIGLVTNMIKDASLDEAKKSIDDLRKLFKGGTYERMHYAKKMFESKNYSAVISYWTYWVSAHLRVSPKNEKIVKDLLVLNQLISQPQYNHRLALENFLLNL